MEGAVTFPVDRTGNHVISVRRLWCAFPFAVVLIAPGSPLDRLQHQFRPAETVSFRMSIETMEGSNRNRQDVALRLTVRTVEPHVAFDARQTSNGVTTDAEITFEPSSGLVRNAKGENLAELSPLLIAYSPTLWGELPSALARDTSWTAESPAWSFGPSGRETVSLTAYDAATRTLKLTIAGSGSGPSRVELDHPTALSVATSVSGSTMRARLVPLKTRWRETIEIDDGLVSRARIDVEREYLVPPSSLVPEFHLTRRIVETITRM